VPCGEASVIHESLNASARFAFPDCIVCTSQMAIELLIYVRSIVKEAGMSRESDIPYDEGMGSSERPNERGIESTASYLADRRLSDIGDDVISWCKRHPVPSLASAAVLGFLMGRCGANRRQQ